ncbi:MAG: AAA family ATPase [Candidatus Obscuribacterales bacterium]|nr:AAA family ATPase [Candidatus Obscuribacterales bacterium]
MKGFFKRHATLLVVLISIGLVGIGVIGFLAKAGNTPEDKQLDFFGGASNPAAITELLDMVRQHPEQIIRIHRQVANGAAFAERIAIEGRDKSIWSITTQSDDQSLSAAIDEVNRAAELNHKSKIPVQNEVLLGKNGEVNVHGGPAAGQDSWGPKLVEWGITIGIIVFIWMMFRKSSSTFSPFNQKSPATMLTDIPGEPITLDDVQGIDEAKDTIKDWIADIKDREEIGKLGGSPKKAVLFVGPPGTGKTMTAKAIGHECGLPTLYMSGADFVNKYVGVGADNVSKVFAEARKARDENAAKAVFLVVDEIDALLRSRASSEGQGNDERTTTLNKWLEEMDGFKDNSGIYFIGMTNRPEIMDPAALRPGRYGFRIELSYPDEFGREQILKVHSRGVPLASDVDLKELAKELPNNSTGATIRELMKDRGPSMARTMARKRGAAALEVSREALLRVAEELEFGAPISEARAARLPARFKEVVRKHETGHLITALVLFEKSNSEKIWGHIPKIISGMGPAGTGGFVKTGIGENMALLSETELRGHMVLGFGGTLAEELYIGVKTVGNQNDIQMINRAADEMVTKFDMSGDEQIPAIAVPRRGGAKYLGGDDAPQYDGLSDESMTQIDRAKARHIRDAKAKARAILKLYEPFFHYFHPQLEKAPALRMYTKEIFEHWENFNKITQIEKPEWLTSDELWSAFWDDRAPNPPTMAELRELKAQARSYRSLSGLL